MTTRRGNPEQRPIYTLRLQPADDGAASLRALKAALKILWRKYRLRCIEISEDRQR